MIYNLTERTDEMACPACDHTLEGVGIVANGSHCYHCPRCGTMILRSGQHEDYYIPRILTGLPIHKFKDMSPATRAEVVAVLHNAFDPAAEPQIFQHESAPPPDLENAWTPIEKPGEPPLDFLNLIMDGMAKPEARQPAIELLHRLAEELNAAVRVYTKRKARLRLAHVGVREYELRFHSDYADGPILVIGFNVRADGTAIHFRESASQDKLFAKIAPDQLADYFRDLAGRRPHSRLIALLETVRRKMHEPQCHPEGAKSV